MKYLIFLVSLIACQKPDPLPAPNPKANPPAGNHSFELRWVAASPVKRTYTYPSANQSSLISRTDTIVGSSAIVYQWPEGYPNTYNHYIDGYLYQATADSIEVQIWIDGTLKAKKIDQGYVSLNYNY